MPDYADLEIGLHRRDADIYAVDMRFTQPDSDVETRLLEESPLLTFDVKALRRRHANDEDYGQTLTQQLLGHADIHEAFNLARANAGSHEAPLRVRLFIGPSAPELHSLRWETLRDPDHLDSTLLTSDGYFFSRYLSSSDWRPIRPRAKRTLKALVAIASPADLDFDQLAPVEVDDELARAQAGLGGVKLLALARVKDAAKFKGLAIEEQVTLNEIQDRLRDGYDILYLVCHGALEKGDPKLWLEDEDGNAAVVSGRELVTRLKELERRPRLVLLASCQSAGTGDQRRSHDGGALSALGPRLAEIGIPAVLAMQGNTKMKTVEKFMPVFLEKLQEDGQVDRAVAMARGAVREANDWWTPVLFMRLKSGRLWYTPGFADPGGFKKLPSLVTSIKGKRCTPILGPGLTDSLFGPWREIARRWAEDDRFPMSPHQREDLSQIAQYVAVTQDYNYLWNKFEANLRQRLLDRYGKELRDYRGSLPDTLDELISAADALRREHDAVELHRVLARLDLPIYITTDPCNLLEKPLRDEGKDPQLVFCPWNEYTEYLPSVYDEEPGYEPCPERPLVYQVFGNLQEPESLVLTEDDCYDFLIGVTKNKELIPKEVRSALVQNALLFLGFQLGDRGFRVLFRSIMSQEGLRSPTSQEEEGRGDARRRGQPSHVAAQVDPEESHIRDPERARQFLQDYFQQARISIYWGSVEDFIRELKPHLSGGGS